MVNRMTIDEAIKDIKDNIKPIVGGKSLDMAIEALKRQRQIPMTKEEIFKAGYEGREIRFRVDGRLFAIRELAQ